MILVTQNDGMLTVSSLLARSCHAEMLGSGAVVQLCSPTAAPTNPVLLVLAPEPSARTRAWDRLRDHVAALDDALHSANFTIPPNWALATTSLRTFGLAAGRTGAADLVDVVHAYRARHALRSVGILGWGVGGLLAVKALESSLTFGAAMSLCAPIGSSEWQ